MYLIIALDLAFLFGQVVEYFFINLNFYDSVYGSNFFLLTGFHGLHVLIGLILLIYCLGRINKLEVKFDHFASFTISS